jgi:hypothetical protein
MDPYKSGPAFVQSASKAGPLAIDLKRDLVRGIYALTHMGRVLFYPARGGSPHVKRSENHLDDLTLVLAKRFHIAV